MSFTSRFKHYSVPVGMKRSFWAPIATEPENAIPTYGDVEELGAARLGTLTYTTSEVDIEGDDQVLDHFEQFQVGSLASESTLNDLEVNAKMYGHTYSDGEESSGGDDKPPFGGYGFTEPILKSGASAPVYRATFLAKVKANPANEAQNAATRQGGSITPAYNNITHSVYLCNTQKWRYRKEFPTEAAAVVYIKTKLGLQASS